jgi:hypothetical protein
VTQEELERQLERLLHDLARDVGDGVAAERIGAVAVGHYERLRREATINDFIPLLVYRFAKEDLVSSSRDELHDAA